MRSSKRGKKEEKKKKKERRKQKEGTPVIPDVGLAHAELLNKPVELVIAIVVLVGPKRVGDSLEAVDHGAGKIVGRVNLVLLSGPRVREKVAPVNNRIPEGLVLGINAHLGTDAVSLTLHTLMETKM